MDFDFVNMGVFDQYIKVLFVVREVSVLNTAFKVHLNHV